MERRFKESKLAVPVAVVAAALGMTACGVDNRSQGDINLSNEGVLSVPGESGGQVSTFECHTRILKGKLEFDNSADQDISISNASVCADEKITPEDFAISK